MLSASLNKTFPSFLVSLFSTGACVCGTCAIYKVASWKATIYETRLGVKFVILQLMFFMTLISCQNWDSARIMVLIILDKTPIIKLFQPVLHDWCNKGRGMCYPVCGMVHIKEPLLLIGKSNPYVVVVASLSCYLNDPLPYVWCHITVNKNVLSASLNKTFPSLHVCVCGNLSTKLRFMILN